MAPNVHVDHRIFLLHCFLEHKFNLFLILLTPTTNTLFFLLRRSFFFVSLLLGAIVVSTHLAIIYRFCVTAMNWQLKLCCPHWKSVDFSLSGSWIVSINLCHILKFNFSYTAPWNQFTCHFINIFFNLRVNSIRTNSILIQFSSVSTQFDSSDRGTELIQSFENCRASYETQRMRERV